MAVVSALKTGSAAPWSPRPEARAGMAEDAFKIISLNGDCRRRRIRGLETLTVVDHPTGCATTIPATALFVLIGAQPHTGWLAGRWRAIPRAICPRASSRPSTPRPPGRSSGRQCSSRPVSPESSPLVTCGLDQSKSGSSGGRRCHHRPPDPRGATASMPDTGSLSSLTAA